MGGKRNGTREHIHFCVAVLILVVIAGCSSVPPATTKEPEKSTRVEVINSSTYLVSGHKLFVERDFARALREYEMSTSVAGSASVREEALFYCGLIYAHPANPRRDYTKSGEYFKRLSEGRTRSVFTEQANIMLSIMKENRESNRTIEKLRSSVEESNRTIEKLRSVIEASKKVDQDIEDKKRESVR